MKKKIIASFAFLIVCLCLTTAVFAGTISYTNVYFENGKSYSGTADMGESISTFIKALEKVNNPVINTKAQQKVFLVFNTGKSADRTIESVDVVYFTTFTSNGSYETKITWKQTNGSASMNANVEANG